MGAIDHHVNSKKIEFMRFNQDGGFSSNGNLWN